MKKLVLTLLFCGYYFFMPFVMVNCSTTDNPYAIDETAAASTSLETCQQLNYITAACVEVLQQAEEQAQEDRETVATAEGAIGDFQTCQQSYTSPDATEVTDSLTTEDEVLDCPTLVNGVLDAVVICESLAEGEQYVGCDNVEEALALAQASCVLTDSSLDEEFCTAVSAE